MWTEPRPLRAELRVTVVYRSLLARLFFAGRRGPWGLALGRRVFFTHPRGLVSDAARNHELIHVCQQAEAGLWRFLWRYLWTERRRPYREKSAEVEAYAHQHDPGYRARRWPGLALTVRER
ncbi:MAG: hypothetical protein AB1578_12040 [Thermodesulfobacteriota bacterium]